jgi:TolB protein
VRRIFCSFLAASLLVLTRCDSGNPDPFDGPPVLPEDADPAVSPEGSRLAYWHKETDPERDGAYPTGLYVLDLTSGERSLVRAGAVFTPDWSPDGERLAVSAGGIAVVRPDGSDFRYLTDHGSAFFPRWSPSGETLSYGRSGNQEEVGLWFIHVTDTTRTRFGYGSNPADWFPDGEQIVFGFLGEEGDGLGQIWRSDTSRVAPVQLTANDFRYNRSPALSPDGVHIAWAAQEGDGRLALWLMRSDGSEQRRLVWLAAGGAHPAWTPDGERVVFQALAPERDRLVLWSIDRDGSDREQLTF